MKRVVGDEMTRILEKKRRLSVEQVKCLEKNFQVENKLEPERKLKLAHDLALHPRQVAVWFQNRRARWKTKQLEQDYSILKSSYDSLNLNLDSLQRDNQALLLQIKDLNSKLELDTVPTTMLVSSDSDSSAVLLAPNDMSSSASTAQFLKIQHHNFHDAFNFFSDDQPPTLPWSDHHWT